MLGYLARAQIGQMIAQILANDHVQADETKDGRLAHRTLRTIPGDQQTIEQVGQEFVGQLDAHLIDGLLHHADGHQILGIFGRLDEWLEDASARLRWQAACRRHDHLFDKLGQLVGRRLLVLLDELEYGQLDVVDELFVLKLEQFTECGEGLQRQGLILATAVEFNHCIERTKNKDIDK